MKQPLPSTAIKATQTVQTSSDTYTTIIVQIYKYTKKTPLPKFYVPIPPKLLHD